jgi:uncharacterized protein YoxC
MLPLNFLTRGSLVVPDDLVLPLVFPGVRGKIKKTITLADGKRLEAGSFAIIQPLNLNKRDECQRFRLTPYKSEEDTSRPDMPEAQRNIIIDSDNSCEVELENPEEYLGLDIEQYELREENLFGDGSPSMDDVKQYKVPNCFFLAPIAAILAQPGGASYIRSMMRQNREDGSTTVRLFNPKTLEPRYIRVQDAYIVDKEGGLSNHSFWVHILEEAAACVPEFFGGTVPSMSDALNSGTRLNAFSILTGCSANETYLNQEKFFAWDIGHFLADELVQLEGLKEIRKEEPAQADKVASAILKPKLQLFAKIFPEETQATFFKLIDFYEANQKEWESIYEQYDNGQARLTQLIEHFSADEKNEDAITILKTLYKYYHDMYNGIYSHEELAIFNDITSKLADGQSLAVGTQQSYEEKVEGLRAKHAYSIIETIDKTNPHEGRGNIKRIRIRNPWGATGRLYLPSMDNPEEVQPVEVREAPIFDLDLKEFCRLFASYSNTIGFNKVKELTEKREALTTKMQDLLKDNDSREEKAEAYFECVQDLVDIQMSAVKLLSDEIHEEIAKALEDGPLSDPKALENVIKANKLLMMNFFQTSDCKLIAASITRWWKDSKEELSKVEDRTYQEQLIESVSKENEHWEKFVENYQYNASLVLGRLNRSIQMVSCLFETISQTKEALEELSENVEGTTQALKALFIQQAMLETHLDFLRKNEDILGLWNVKIDILLKQSDELNLYINNLLEKNSWAHLYLNKIKEEVLNSDLAIDEFTNKAEGLLVDMGLLINEYVEVENEPNPAIIQDEKHWLIALKGIIEHVLSIIFTWKYPPAPAPEYNRPAKHGGAANCEMFGIFKRKAREYSPVPQEPSTEQSEDSKPIL